MCWMFGGFSAVYAKGPAKTISREYNGQAYYDCTVEPLVLYRQIEQPTSWPY